MCFLLVQSFVVTLFFLFGILFSANHRNSREAVVLNKIIFIMKISCGIVHTGLDAFQTSKSTRGWFMWSSTFEMNFMQSQMGLLSDIIFSSILLNLVPNSFFLLVLFVFRAQLTWVIDVHCCSVYAFILY